MKTWEEMVCKAKDLANAAGRKASGVVDLTKQKLKMAENEKAIESTLEALGRLLYDSRQNDTELNEETVAELITQVQELSAANEELQAAIDNNCGRKTCPSCSTANPQGAAYCNNCGKEL